MTSLKWKQMRELVIDKEPTAKLQNGLHAYLHRIVTGYGDNLTRIGEGDTVPAAWTDAYNRLFPSVPVAAQEGEQPTIELRDDTIWQLVNEVEREAFVRYAREIGGCDLTTTRPPDTYRSVITERLWKTWRAAWQARASLDAPPEMTPEEHEDFTAQKLDIASILGERAALPVEGATKLDMQQRLPSYDDCTPDEARQGEDYARLILASGYGGDVRDAISTMFACHLAYRRLTENTPASKPEPSTPKPQIVWAICNECALNFTEYPDIVRVCPKCYGETRQVRFAESSTIPVAPKDEIGLGVCIHSSFPHRSSFHCRNWKSLSVPSVAAKPLEGMPLFPHDIKTEATPAGITYTYDAEDIRKYQVATFAYVDAQSLALAAAKDENQKIWNLAKRLRDFIEFSPLCSTEATNIVLEADTALEVK